MWRGWSVFAITAVAVIALQKAHAANTSNNSAETEAVTVTGEATGSLTSVSPEESAKQQKGALLLRWRFLELVNH
jgi:multidrug resistance efflux pump